MWWGWLWFVYLVSASSGPLVVLVVCHHCSLLTAPPQLTNVMAQRESRMFLFMWPESFLDWSVVVAPVGGLFSLVEQRELKGLAQRDALSQRGTLGKSLALRQLSAIRRLTIKLHWNLSEAVPGSHNSFWSPSGAGCYTIAISERSKCPSPCVLGDCESSLRFAGIVMY